MRIAIVAAALALSSLTTACVSREHPVLAISGANFAAATATTTDRATAIKAALKERGWAVDKEQPGAIMATYTKPNKDVPGGAHTATIGIEFDATTFSIKYVDSKNMMYDAAEGTIHRNYNRWVANLERDLMTLPTAG